ncbi:hypothetical protein OEB99_08210 [Actinotalea sp. M2MS4P-6]|uniref:hypothetical protein n=1 Tax=Actinotalea sp. M2MS4P-6 TaxID=2983762 RepID=UPI0021E4ED6A|nr:hypothetical protein [Actinotalea sp. M2MS4P-6]MCV2394289.1 hypothetical protein [Actinotalea sp. M2MS4P-6]
MSKRRAGLAVGTAAAAAAITLGGASLALAQTDSPSAAVTASSDAAADGSTDSSTDGTRPERGASQDTAVTGDEADKVIAAVQAQDADAQITEVRQDPDGSYDAIGTSGSEPVFYDVSADLATVTARTGGGGHGDGGPGASQDTAVTGDEADKVIAAVQAQDADAQITEVRQDPDGSYDAIGTSGGEPVFYDVSADLATVTAHTGGGGHGDGGPGRGGHGPGSTDDGSTDSGSSTDGGVSSGNA